MNLAETSLMPLSANEHRQIVKAIASGDAELAGRALFEHVMESKGRTLKNHPREAAEGDAPAESGGQKAPR